MTGLSIPPWFDCGRKLRAGGAHERTAFNPTLVRLRPQTQARVYTTEQSFNPTLVRLRHGESSAWGACGDVSFNPTLVRLRRITTGPLLRSLTAFNPTLVRLRPVLRSRPRPQPRLSIPPWFDCGSMCGYTLWPAVGLSIPPWFDCGYDTCAARHSGTKGAFNPTLVRLRRAPLLWATPRPRPLSIPPWFDCGAPQRRDILPLPGAFNPTLVRLRLKCGRGPAGPVKRFQSHLGSIAAYLPPAPARRCTCFQSHLGSIAAAKRPYWLVHFANFQSHLGSIAASLGRFVASGNKKLSIPPWFDCGHIRLESMIDGSGLSIPPWFDCGLEARLMADS